MWQLDNEIIRKLLASQLSHHLIGTLTHLLIHRNII